MKYICFTRRIRKRLSNELKLYINSFIKAIEAFKGGLGLPDSEGFKFVKITNVNYNNRLAQYFLDVLGKGYFIC